MEDRMRSIIEKMGWSLSYYDKTPWHPETVEDTEGFIDLYGVDDVKEDDYPVQNSGSADYFCTVKKEDSKNVRVDKADREYIPLLELVYPELHFYIK